MTINQQLEKYRTTLEVLKDLIAIRRAAVIDEKPIPIAIPRTNNKYPWHRIAPGKSFLVPCADNALARERTMNSLTSCIANIRRRSGKNFCQRKVAKGIRVWRTL